MAPGPTLDNISDDLREIDTTIAALQQPLLNLIHECHQQNEINRAILNAHNEQKKALFAHLKSHHLARKG